MKFAGVQPIGSNADHQHRAQRAPADLAGVGTPPARPAATAGTGPARQSSGRHFLAWAPAGAGAQLLVVNQQGHGGQDG